LKISKFCSPLPECNVRGKSDFSKGEQIFIVIFVDSNEIERTYTNTR
jgi:hypothetical protein